MNEQKEKVNEIMNEVEELENVEKKKRESGNHKKRKAEVEK